MPPVRVAVNPIMFRWARERARLTPVALERAFPRLTAWERGEQQPTLKQLEQYARRTRAPIGYFFLQQPPEEPLPIPDFRTVRDEPIARPSADLLNTIYACQNRQDWYRQYLRLDGRDPLPFVGALEVGTDERDAADLMRTALQFNVEERTTYSFADAFRALRRLAEDVGILVMSSGIAGNATRYALDPDEFRGFALVDDYAPLVFVNSADSTGAQIFTLAHELVHIWTGRTGVIDAGLLPGHYTQEERWCNRVAAELLVPLHLLEAWYDANAEQAAELERLARLFKVSTLVVLRRVFDAGFLTEAAFWRAYRAEVARIEAIRQQRPKSEGGNFYNSELARVNRQFAAAVVSSTLEGHTTYTEAFRLLSVKNVHTLHEVGRQVGVLA